VNYNLKSGYVLFHVSFRVLIQICTLFCNVILFLSGHECIFVPLGEKI